ncbi:MAG: ribonuclease R [Gammaproteobacteria bacterium]|nr:ribonuclease R [Gammaproteobacteria bacterium]
MSKFHPKKDPHRQREAERYENPIPSREYILSYLENKKVPEDFSSIKKGLKLTGDKFNEGLRRRLSAMQRDGQLMRDRRRRFALINHLDLKHGRVEGHRDGFGFVIFDDKTEDWFLSPRQMRSTLHGDEVLVRLKGDNWKGKTEAAIVKVIKPGIERVVGRYCVESHTAFVVPDDNRITQDIQIPPNQALKPTEGQIVVADIVRRPGNHAAPLGEIIEILGDHMDPGMEIDVSIRSYGIPHEWPEQIHDAVNNLQPVVSEKDKKGRIDLRDLPLVTIDGSDSKDFDDAVHCRREENGQWRLWVAIADVSHYVKPGNILDQEAYKRGNSVYFPGHVVPMLPEILSNGLCSLNPDVDRLCMVCEMTISKNGKLQGYKFYPGLMRSHARLTYSEVWSVLDGDANKRKALAPLVGHLEELHALYKQLLKSRKNRGGIDFDTVETRIEFTDERKIGQIVPVIRNDAHRLIEECMILANVAAARYFLKKKSVGIYRVHDLPKAKGLETLRQYLAMHGLSLGGGEEPKPVDYQQLMNQAKGRPDTEQIQILLLRSLSQAIYHPDNIGHFGLALPAYTHFTSPIRRYPDLVVHRTIKALLQQDQPDLVGIESGQRYSHEEMDALGEHTVITERRADEATKQVTSWLKCEFMLERIGQEFDGQISGVTAFGIFVRLDDIFVEGLVHVTALANDYYHFDPVSQHLTGEGTGTVLRMGDKVRIKVVEVNLDERKIDFECIRHEMKAGKTKVRTTRKPATRGKKVTSKGKKPVVNSANKKTRTRKTKVRTPKSGGAKPQRSRR